MLRGTTTEDQTSSSHGDSIEAQQPLVMLVGALMLTGCTHLENDVHLAAAMFTAMFDSLSTPDSQPMNGSICRLSRAHLIVFEAPLCMRSTLCCCGIYAQSHGLQHNLAWQLAVGVKQGCMLLCTSAMVAL